MKLLHSSRSLPLLLAGFSVLVFESQGCQKRDRSGDSASRPTPSRAGQAPGSPQTSAAAPELLPGPTDNTPLAPHIASELQRAHRDGKQLLVYVGAEWCEPCLLFHQAVKRGELANTFPTLRLIDLDFDRDQEHLEAAGYDLSWLPLFAVPAADGRATGRRAAGTVKGDAAVPSLVPRILALLRTRAP